MRRGIMGGTFDPIHLGHLRAAELAREALALDEVVFVPAGQPPHRPAAASGFERLVMAALATSGHPAFRVHDMEVQRDGPSYTVDTLRALREVHPDDELVLILGTDAFAEIATWRDPAQVFALCTIGLVPRPGVPRPPVPAAARVADVPGPELAISSTAVRERVRGGKSIRYLVPEPVARHVETRGLYR